MTKREERLLVFGKICFYCGIKLDSNTQTTDTLIPKSKGGKDGTYNKVISCLDCNIWKGEMLIEQPQLKILQKKSKEMYRLYRISLKIKTERLKRGREKDLQIANKILESLKAQ